MATRTSPKDTRVRRKDLAAYSLTRIFHDNDGTTREHLVGLFTTPSDAAHAIRTMAEELRGGCYRYLVIEGIPRGAFGIQVFTHSWWVYHDKEQYWKQLSHPPQDLYYDDRQRRSKWSPIGII